ncbi:MAG TPA: class I SAM-dependent methyltransferase [Dissulfurispiraceae bacterium]|nr:class I SAM-dependent methyltransferase [Dissulfurispiraceae bacterium]
MDELSKEYIISFFNKNLMLHGDRPEAVRWTAPGQTRHFEAMLDIGDIKGAKVLDFGCGKGDFYQFLKGRSISTEYTGLDINERLISTARLKHPDVDFRVFDMDKDVLQEEFDYIFLCGVFNLRIDRLDEIIRDVLKKLFACCRVALAFNALSAHNPEKDFELSYISPEEMFAFAVKELSPFVSLRHDRIAYDYTMFVYRNINSLIP